ncbi:helix-turn-helix domain-containing protein [Rhodocytophaga aerolata]|uniref:Helix-turn-helix domain-containing protein n=1 Tax=Rhodocytophaga aerolata TaxID=455078 RepID=A0ABT8RDF0_9BACT|nr:helix-turn-helix domain-containing protein [Rhodocytophaga aerolata]MDO1449233.1 helix-turn-helix domain-containing protein [Rhodocytophaga aerolata]
MVCPRCIKVVKDDMEKLGLEVEHIQLGEVTVKSADSSIDMNAVKNILVSEGFELIEDKQGLIVEEIKTTIIELIYSGKIENIHINFSDYLAAILNKDYHYMSNAFSTLEHITVEKFYILQKIERAKELLSYHELSLGEIARKLGYSNIAHFSNQFKRIVGTSPTQYRKENGSRRKFIDQLK